MQGYAKNRFSVRPRGACASGRMVVVVLAFAVSGPLLQGESGVPSPEHVVNALFPEETVSPTQEEPSGKVLAGLEKLLGQCELRLRVVEERLGPPLRRPTLSASFERRVEDIEKRLARMERVLDGLEQRVRRLETQR